MYAGLIRPGQVLPGPYPKDLRGTQGPAFGELPERLKLKGKEQIELIEQVHNGT